MEEDFREFVLGVESLSESQPKFWKHPQMNSLFYCKTALAAYYIALCKNVDEKREFFQYSQYSAPLDLSRELLSRGDDPEEELVSASIQKIGREYLLKFGDEVINPTTSVIFTLGN